MLPAVLPIFPRSRAFTATVAASPSAPAEPVEEPDRCHRPPLGHRPGARLAVAQIVALDLVAEDGDRRVEADGPLGQPLQPRESAEPLVRRVVEELAFPP